VNQPGLFDGSKAVDDIDEARQRLHAAEVALHDAKERVKAAKEAVAESLLELKIQIGVHVEAKRKARGLAPVAVGEFRS
jgi:hypothetical protein